MRETFHDGGVSPTGVGVAHLPAESVWASNRPKKKSSEDYVAIKEKYEVYTKGNEFLTIPEALEAVSVRIISLLTADVVTHRLINVSRDTMNEALNCLQVFSKILTRGSSVMWDIQLVNEEEVKKLTVNVQITMSVRLQTEYMGTGRIKVTLHGIVITDLWCRTLSSDTSINLVHSTCRY